MKSRGMKVAPGNWGDTKAISSCSDVPGLNRHWFTDAGQIATPAYKSPGSVAGIELRVEAQEGDPQPDIELAFYRRTAGSGTRVVVVLEPPADTHCIVDGQGFGRDQSFYTCAPWAASGSGRRECLPSDVEPDFSRPVAVTAVLFGVWSSPLTQVSATMRADCENAATLLATLSPRSSSSSIFRSEPVQAEIASTVIGRSGRVAFLATGETCNQALARFSPGPPMPTPAPLHLGWNLELVQCGGSFRGAGLQASTPTL